MSRKKKEPTPNYEIMFRCAVSALQSAYEEYKRATIEELKMSFIGNEGGICWYNGIEKKEKQREEALKEAARLSKEVEELRKKVEP